MQRQKKQSCGTQILQKPLIILLRLLGEVAQRAAEINDAKLNGLMADLTLYEVTDGYSKEYNAKLRQEIINGKHGVDAVKAVNEHDALVSELCKIRTERLLWNAEKVALNAVAEAVKDMKHDIDIFYAHHREKDNRYIDTLNHALKTSPLSAQTNRECKN